MAVAEGDQEAEVESRAEREGRGAERRPSGGGGVRLVVVLLLLGVRVELVFLGAEMENSMEIEWRWPLLQD
jgi:hypothetical protein